MKTLQTEFTHQSAKELDTLPDPQVLEALLDGQKKALDSVHASLTSLAHGARLMAEALLGQGRLFYVGAGSSALMASADALELAGTFGIDPSRVHLCMAGGLPVDSRMPGDTEDNREEAEVIAATLSAHDVAVIVSASGQTPYSLSFAEKARQMGASLIVIANNNDAPLFHFADVRILLLTPPELIAGSTRMGAGTAQKAALNMMSTLAGIHLGHIHDGMMVNLNPDNDKLRRRAVEMVMTISKAERSLALKALKDSHWSVKVAVLTLSGAESSEAAKDLLESSRNRLREALGKLKGVA